MSTSTYEQMKSEGSAHWLLLFLREHKTEIAGRIVTYEWISEQMGEVPERTLRSWMSRLKKLGLVEIRRKAGVEIVLHGR